MRRQLFSLIVGTLAIAMCCNASVIVFQDLTDLVSITMDGQPVTGNGGRVTNFVKSGESISFDLTAPGVSLLAFAGFTNLLDGPSSDDPVGTVSDRFVQMFAAPFAAVHIAFGSDPDLPTIPPGAADLTMIPAQGLPSNPYYEDGTVQKVGTLFNSNGSVSDTFFIQSDVSDVPEPGTSLLIGTSLALIVIARRKLAPIPV
jgi:hypothetical protein